MDVKPISTAIGAVIRLDPNEAAALKGEVNLVVNQLTKHNFPILVKLEEKLNEIGICFKG